MGDSALKSANSLMPQPAGGATAATWPEDSRPRGGREPVQLLTPRYRLRAPLGAGSMGVVYRADDRLSGQTVALKQVSLPADFTDDEVQAELLRLADEFRTLAGLRHPHIISVLDYGFDAGQHPFYTMELLEGARTILDAGRPLPTAERVGLLLQALEALAYLHRRGVLHHDLKPENILVAGGRVRLLDFGLATLTSQARDDDAFGTIQYLAPEVLLGESYDITADLYAIGVIAYELFAGRHPFPARTIRDFINQAISEPPDLSVCAEPPALVAVIGRLLAKVPAERPPTAQATIRELCAADGRPTLPERPDIRESYLQAATFVGRHAELAQLTDALAAAQRRQGSVWLIGGESGVGKSRLISELRTHALVEGFQVLHGQEVERGGMPYQIWREPLRHLALATALGDLAAGVLLAEVGDLGGLLGRPIIPAPPLAGRAAQERLNFTIVDLFRSQTRPTLLILEDLHWTGDGLEPLRQLIEAAPELPLCIVASYRDDERPDLPRLLPVGHRQIKLDRLTIAETAALCSAIVGDGVVNASIISFLQRQTEGNALFLIEVIRALAAEAGDLARIAAQELPRSVLPGGFLQTLQRRLWRIPAWGQEPLRLAATMGRQIDRAALAHLCPAIDLDRWLLLCTDAAVLEATGEEWRFSHDKLREAALIDCSPPQRQRLHQRVAEAIEARHTGDSRHAIMLFEHWDGAGRPDKAAEYAAIAARMLIDIGASGEAHLLLEQALANRSAAVSSQRYLTLLILDGEACRNLSDYPAAQRRLEDALEQATGEERIMGEVLLQLGALQLDRGQYGEAFALLDRAASIWERLGDQRGTAKLLLVRGMAQQSQGHIAEALVTFAASLAHYRAIGDQPGIAECLINLGALRLRTVPLPEAWGELHAGVQLAESINNRALQYHGLHQLATLAIAHGDLGRAIDYQQRALEIAHATGRRRDEVNCLINLGVIYARQANFPEGVRCWEQSLHLAQRINARNEVGLSLINLAEIRHNVRGAPEAAEEARAALAIMRAIPSPSGAAYTLHLLGDIARDQGDLAEAAQRYSESQAIMETISNPGMRLGLLTKQGKLAYVRGDLALASRIARQAVELARQLNNRLELIDNLAQLASLALRAGGAAQADTALAEGLQLAQATPRMTVINNLLISLAERHLAHGARSAAREALDYVRSHPMLNRFLLHYRIPPVVAALERDPIPAPPTGAPPEPAAEQLARLIAAGIAAVSPP